MENKPHTHCWHDSGVALTSMPPQYKHICCHCGEIKIVIPQTINSFKGHGKYHPQNYITGFIDASS
jgi:hypothetical protein